MEAVIFAASGVLIYKLWRGVQEGGPRTKAVEVREIAVRPPEPVAAQLPDASSTTTPAAQAEAIESILGALPDHSGDTRGQVSAGYGFIGKVAPGQENSYTRAMAAQAAEKQRVMSRSLVTPARLLSQ